MDDLPQNHAFEYLLIYLQQVVECVGYLLAPFLLAALVFLVLGIKNGWMKGLHSSLKRNSFMPLILPIGALVYAVCDQAQNPHGHGADSFEWHVFCTFFVAFIGCWTLLLTRYRGGEQTWWLVGLLPIQAIFSFGCFFIGAMPITGNWL